MSAWIPEVTETVMKNGGEEPGSLAAIDGAVAGG
jgi:hypothetical protein